MRDEWLENIRITFLDASRQAMEHGGIVFDHPDDVKEHLVADKNRRNKGLGMDDPQRIRHWHQLVNGLEECTDYEVKSALQLGSFESRYARVVEQVKQSVTFLQAQAARNAAPPSDESRQPSMAPEASVESAQAEAPAYVLGGGSGGFLSAGTGTPAAARSAPTHHFSFSGASTPKTFKARPASAAGFFGGGTPYPGAAVFSPTSAKATPKLQDLIGSPLCRMSISAVGQEADNISQLSGGVSLAEVTKSDLMGGLCNIEDILRLVNVPDALKKVTTDETFAEDQIGFLVSRNDAAASATVDAAHAFKCSLLAEVKKRVVDERANHEKVLSQTRDLVEAARLQAIDGEKKVNRLKTEADEGKKLVAEDVERGLKQAEQEKELKLASFNRKIELEYDAVYKEIKSKGNERAQAYDDKLGDAENLLEIFFKSHSNLQKELTKREEVKIETVDLAQERLDLMKAATDLIFKIKKAADPVNELGAEYQDFLSKIRAYNSKVDMIDRGTFRA